MEKIDPQKLNTVFNQLKELVGDQGAFILYVNKGFSAASEDSQIRTYGPPMRLMGLLSVCTGWTQDALMQNLNELVKVRPPEPD